jgi:ACR3 family arsenite transporter
MYCLIRMHLPERSPRCALQVVSGGAGTAAGFHVSFWQVARSVLLFLGIPLVAGIITRYAALAALGKERFNKRFMAYFGPVALLGLIYTIIVMFSLQGHQVMSYFGIYPVASAKFAMPLQTVFPT